MIGVPRTATIVRRKIKVRIACNEHEQVLRVKRRLKLEPVIQTTRS